MKINRYIVWAMLIWMISLSSAEASTVTNSVTGTLNGNSLDLSRAVINLNRAAPVDQGRSTVTADPVILPADGISRSTLTAILRDSISYPVSGKTVLYSSDRLGADTFEQPAGVSDANGSTVGYIRSSTPGKSSITATITEDNIAIAMKPTVYFSQGQVLEITKTANKKEAVIGDVVTYMIEIRNKTNRDATMVKIDDVIPPNFKYLKGSVRLNGQKVADPAGNRTLTFDLGTVPALVDANGNGKADKGETGYFSLSYQLIIGSGATPKEYINTAVAKDVCDQCYISNASEAKVTVTIDPIFDLGTIIGKVFDDKNGNGYQDRDEPGVPGAMVALDDGTYALTDEHGRYHFPAVKPGHRMVKINIESLPDGMAATEEDSRIVSVTPGILAKANFGVYLRQETETIGKPPVMGLAIRNEAQQDPVQVAGSTETMTVLVNGQPVKLPGGNIKLNVESEEEMVEIKGNALNRPIIFRTSVEDPESITKWRFTVTRENNQVLRTMKGMGAPPETVEWDAKTDEGTIVDGGQVYRYQIEADYADGSRSKSPRRLIGINRTTAISLSMTGSAFKTGTAILSDKARRALGDVAEIMRKYPHEKIHIDGHTDDVGSDAYNLDLSKRRATAAAAYLISNEGISGDRFVITGYGKQRPVASNRTPEGKELNRRIEIRGETSTVERAEIQDQFRTDPFIEINGAPLKTDTNGRFSYAVEDAESVDIRIGNRQASLTETTVPIPQLDIFNFKADKILAYGHSDGRVYVLDAAQTDGSGTIGLLKIAGQTDAGNSVYIDGEPVETDGEGIFRSELKFKLGRNQFGVMIKNEEGFIRIASLTADLSDRDGDGKLIVVVKRTPNLSVKLPPKGVSLRTQNLVVSGSTDPGNSVTVNGEPVTMEADGQFTASVNLKMGANKLRIEAKDPEGHNGMIVRDVNVTDSRLFLMAFADGKVGQLQSSGYVKGAGDRHDGFYSEGRVAYYLKGYVAGKYLITSAFDTGTREFGSMFKDLDKSDNDRLLTNLDPDKLYPVYGDSSTIVYDVQSQGKFYLSVDSDELHVVMGNYQLSMNDVELAAYNRTLYGAKVSYQSLAKTKYGQPDTKVIVFGAEVRQAHARDEMRATGGSLYYLSHKNVIEGSEQVTLEIRDKDTGLILSRMPQQQNVDYNVKYPEGRILFNRPISSMTESSSLINRNILAGNPVYVAVDYETVVDSFQKTAEGGHVRKQLGDHLAVGGTYVKDELSAGSYEMQGVDAEVRVGKNTRFIAEHARTTGANSTTFVSDDGGITFRETTPTGFREGDAWKLAAEIDAGEWIRRPDRFYVGGYFKRLDDGFVSSGNLSEHGSEKSGVNTKLRLTGSDTLIAKFDQERIFGEAVSNISALAESRTTTIQLTHEEGWWSIAGEYQGRESYSLSGAEIEDSGYAAARLRLNPTEKLTLKIERQETVKGPVNDQSSVSVNYQALKNLGLTALATEGTLGRSAQAGMTLNIGKGKVYLAERINDDTAGHSSSTIAGAESSLDGTSSGKIYTEYQWERSDRGNRNLSVVGALKRWDKNQGWSFMLTGEHSRVEADPVPTTRYTIGAGTSYKNSGFSFLTRAEERTEEGAVDRVQYLSVNQIEIKISPDYTVMMKYRYSVTKNLSTDSTEAEFEERGIGLAYRPVDNDRFNAIARYTWLSDRRPLSLGETDWTVSTANVLSAEWSLEITRNLEWVEKEALKIKTEMTGDRDPVTTHTYLGIHRINLNAWKRLDFGMEYRMLKQMEADDQRDGFLAEVMWKVVKQMRFGVGFNFTNFSDNEFSDNNYSVYGWFIRFQGRY